ncbi:MAG: SRPBCC family protein [Nannocystales bacterium]
MNSESNNEFPVQPIRGKHRIEASIEVDAPIEAAWAVIADFNDIYLWAPSVEDSRGITASQRCVGAGRQCTIKGFGKIDEVITDWKEGREFTYAVGALGPFKGSRSRWQLESLSPTRSRLTLQLSYDMRMGFLGDAMNALVMRRKLQQSLDGILEPFKRRVETGEVLRPVRSAAA